MPVRLFESLLIGFYKDICLGLQRYMIGTSNIYLWKTFLIGLKNNSYIFENNPNLKIYFCV